MDFYDKKKVGKLIAWGGDHFVHDYDTDKVIKFSFLDFFLGQKARGEEMAEYYICKKFFGEYVLATTIVASPNKKRIAFIQPKVTGHFLSLQDLKHEVVRKQFKEIMDGYFALIRAGNSPIDLIGRAGAFSKRMSNIFVTDDYKLVIVEITLLDITTQSVLLQPFLFVIWGLAIPCQNYIIESFLSEMVKYE